MQQTDNQNSTTLYQPTPRSTARSARRWSGMIVFLSIPIFMLMMAGVSAIRAGMIVVYPAGYIDPFVAYDAITPGKSIAALKAYTCDAVYLPAYINPRPACIVKVKNGIFREVSVTADGDQVIALLFSGQNLTLLDLTQRWGLPDSQRRTYQGIELYWGVGIYALAAPTGYLQQRSLITSVTIGCGVDDAQCLAKF